MIKHSLFPRGPSGDENYPNESVIHGAGVSCTLAGDNDVNLIRKLRSNDPLDNDVKTHVINFGVQTFWVEWVKITTKYKTSVCVTSRYLNWEITAHKKWQSKVKWEFS